MGPPHRDLNDDNGLAIASARILREQAVGMNRRPESRWVAGFGGLHAVNKPASPSQGPVKSPSQFFSGRAHSKVMLGLAATLVTVVSLAGTGAFRDHPEGPEVRSVGPTETLNFPPDRDVRVARSAEDQTVALINAYRASRGLSTLLEDQRLQSLARRYSYDMYTRGYFGHVDPEGETPFDRLLGSGIRYSAAAENLAMAPSPSDAFEDFLDSPDHRRHLLDPVFCEVGIGAYTGSRGLIVTVLFLVDDTYGVPPSEGCHRAAGF